MVILDVGFITFLADYDNIHVPPRAWDTAFTLTLVVKDGEGRDDGLSTILEDASCDVVLPKSLASICSLDGHPHFHWESVRWWWRRWYICYTDWLVLRSFISMPSSSLKAIILLSPRNCFLSTDFRP